MSGSPTELQSCDGQRYIVVKGLLQIAVLDPFLGLYIPADCIFSEDMASALTGAAGGHVQSTDV